MYRHFAADVYLSEASSPPRFLLGLSSNFVGSKSGQIWNVKLLQNMVSNRTEQHPPSQPHTVCTGKGGES
jgi:hypothetical protein